MIGWLDGSAGASGDMLLGALVDVGVPIEVMRAPLDRLGLGIELRTEHVVRASLGALRVHVDVPETRTLRHLADVETLLFVLDESERALPLAVFERLAAAEAAVHRTSIDEVHFHEVGALDSIADIVGVCAGFRHLANTRGLTALHCSTLSLGNGTVRGAHGPIPVPAPAVLALLAGRPVKAGPAPFEATTPTGAALLEVFVTQWGPMPPMTVERIGSGAGAKDSTEVANALRLVIGEPIDDGAGSIVRSTGMIQIDANVDDMDPRVWPVAIDAALAAGAVDAWVTPIVMKKGRPAHTFSALTDDEHAADVRDAIFRHTSTIGLRERHVDRHTLDRTSTTVDVGGHAIGVKHAMVDGDVVNTSVEWDDVMAAAAALGRAPRDVLRDAERAASTP